jgi:hypothetical protein
MGEFVDQPTNDPLFLIGQRQAVQPLLSSLAEQVARVLRNQIGMKDGVYTPFRSNHLFENAHMFGGLASAPLGFFISDPDFRQEAARMQFGQDDCVDLVGLHPRIRDRANHPRVRNDDPLDKRSQNSLDGRAVASGLDDDFVRFRKRLGKLDEPIVNQIDPLLLVDLPFAQKCDLCE